LNRKPSTCLRDDDGRRRDLRGYRRRREAFLRALLPDSRRRPWRPWVFSASGIAGVKEARVQYGAGR
jgi:hypothetical protein